MGGCTRSATASRESAWCAAGSVPSLPRLPLAPLPPPPLEGFTKQLRPALRSGLVWRAGILPLLSRGNFLQSRLQLLFEYLVYRSVQ